MNQTNQTQAQQPKMEVARKIDDIASKALEIFNGADMDFEKELAVAQAMGDMRALLTPQVMAPVMALMNSPLGFMTDQNPLTRNDARPYSVEVVRDCFIEAKLRGFHALGNEFNIIAGRFYGAKAGIVRKVLSFPGVTDVKDTYEVPRLMPDKGGALVKCKITWKRDGNPDSLERDFPVKVNQYMGSDAILGKCTRKLFAAALSHLTGKATPDGEAGDDGVVIVDDVPPNTKPAGTTQAAKPAGKPAKPAQSKKDSLGAWMTEKQFTWSQIQPIIESEKVIENADSIGSFDDLTEDQAADIFGARTGIEFVLGTGGSK